jgi:hypothetical protein
MLVQIPLTPLEFADTVIACTSRSDVRDMGKESQMTRIKQIVLAAIVGALMLVAVPGAAQAASKPSLGCSPGFNLGALTVDQILQLPRSQAAIAAGVVDEAGIRAGVASVDKNGTGRVCVQLSNGLVTSKRPNGQFFYNLVDDNASVR